MLMSRVKDCSPLTSQVYDIFVGLYAVVAIIASAQCVRVIHAFFKVRSLLPCMLQAVCSRQLIGSYTGGAERVQVETAPAARLRHAALGLDAGVVPAARARHRHRNLPSHCFGLLR